MIKDRLQSAAFEAGWSLVCRLPESWARTLFTLGADIAWSRQGGGVQVLEGNLQRVLGPDADGAELRAVSREVMRSYARYYMEAFRIQTIPKERVLAGMHNDSPNVPLTMKYLQDGPRRHLRPAAHGQLRARRALDRCHGRRSFTTVAERLKPESVYRARSSRFREGLGMEVLPPPADRSPFGILAQRLRAGKLVCLVADRDLSRHRHRGRLLRREGADAPRAGGAGVQTGAALMPVDAAGSRATTGARTSTRRSRCPPTGDRAGEGRRDDPGARAGLRGGHRRSTRRTGTCCSRSSSPT